MACIPGAKSQTPSLTGPAEAVRAYLQGLQDQKCSAVLGAMSDSFKQVTLQNFGGQDAFCSALNSHRRNHSFSIGSTTSQAADKATVQATIVKEGGTNVLNVQTVKQSAAWRVDRLLPVEIEAVDLYMSAVAGQIGAQLSARNGQTTRVDCSQTGLISVSVGTGLSCSFSSSKTSGQIVVVAHADGSWTWQPVS